MGKQSKQVKRDEQAKSIDYRDLPLQPGETGRIIITRHSNGAITTLTAGPGHTLSFFEAIGMIETSKFEAMYAARLNSVNSEPEKEVEIIFDEIDKEMDVNGLFEKAGIELGVPTKVPESAAKLRELQREQYLKNHPKDVKK